MFHGGRQLHSCIIDLWQGARGLGALRTISVAPEPWILGAWLLEPDVWNEGGTAKNEGCFEKR